MTKLIRWISAVFAALLIAGGMAVPALASTTAPNSASVAQPPQVPGIDGHATQPGGPDYTPPPGQSPPPPGLPSLNGPICNGNRGGNCWWEAAVEIWYKMDNGTNMKNEMNTIWNEYSGNFQDGWADDNAWWGIALRKADQLYGVGKYTTQADSLWTYDTTTHSDGSGWDPNCGGSPIQHAGGSQNDISRATLGVLASTLGKTSSAQNAAAWIYQHMQGSDPNAAVAEGLSTQSSSPCSPAGTAELGGQTESWKVEQLTSAAGQAGTLAAANAECPDSNYDGAFNLTYAQYIGTCPN